MTRFTLAPVPKNPSELLAILVSTHGDKSELARTLGVSYVTVNRWTKGEHFNRERQEEVARALGLPLDYFAQPDLAAARESARERVLGQFLKSPQAGDVTEAERITLSSIRFAQGVPTTSLYQAILLDMRGHLREDPTVAAERHDRERDNADAKGDPFGDKLG